MVILFCFTVVTNIDAQNIYTPHVRHVIDRALTTIEDYETLSSISDEESYYAFQDLFTSPNLRIINDYNEKRFGWGLTIPVKDYADSLFYNAKNKQVFISNIHRESIWKETDVIKIQYSFCKTLKYVDKCGKVFPQKESFKDYILIVTLVYDEEKDICKIEKLIKKNVNKVAYNGEKIEDDFYFIGSSDYDKNIKYNNHLLDFNSYHQAILESPMNVQNFKYDDEDVIAVPIVEKDCKTVTMSYKVKRFAIKPHYDLGLGEAYTLTEANTFSSTKTKSNNWGVDFGFFFPSKGRIKLGGFIGVNMTQSSIDLSYNNPDYFFNAVDVDGENYNRHYKNISLNQSFSFSELSIPLYLDLSTTVHKFVKVYANLGAKLNLGISNKVNEITGSAYVYGIYPQHSNLIMDEHWGYNGFGTQNYASEQLDNKTILNFSNFTADLLGALGFRFSIPSFPCMIDLGINYNLGLGNYLKGMDFPVNLEKSEGSDNAIIYNTFEGVDSKEHVRNTIESLESIKRKSMRFNIGLIYKF